MESNNEEEEEPLLDPDSHAMNLRRHVSNSTSQLAIVGSTVTPIESLDYEIVENDFFKQDWRSRGRGQILQYVMLKWTLCLLIGALAACVGFFNNLAVENIAGVKFVVTYNMMLAQKYGWAFGVFGASNLVLTMFAAVITAYIAPAAAINEKGRANNDSVVTKVKDDHNYLVDKPGVGTKDLDHIEKHIEAFKNKGGDVEWHIHDQMS